MFFVGLAAGAIFSSLMWLGVFKTQDWKEQRRLRRRVTELKELLNVHWQDNTG